MDSVVSVDYYTQHCHMKRLCMLLSSLRRWLTSKEKFTQGKCRVISKELTRKRTTRNPTQRLKKRLGKVGQNPANTKSRRKKKVRKVCKFVVDVLLPKVTTQLHKSTQQSFRMITDWLEVNMETDESAASGTPTLPSLLPDCDTPPSPPLSPLQLLSQTLTCISARQDEGDGQNVNDVYAELQARMETIKKQEKVLQCEIGDIRQRFLTLLKSCGAENVPGLSQSLASLDLPDPNSSGMNTPRRPVPPRRASNQQRLRTPDNMRCMYADLLIEQLLAQATSLTDSSDLSNSPPEQTSSSEGQGAVGGAAAAAASVNVNVSTPKDTERKEKEFSNYQVPPDYHQTPRRRIGLSATNIRVNGNGTLGSDVLTTSSNSLPDSASSDVYPNSSDRSSENQVVPDLETELLSRMQYYSDFTIDRQKKIDEGAMMTDVNDENVAPTSSDQSSEGLSQRCVEGSESQHHVIFQIPRARISNTPTAPVSRASSVRGKRGRVSPPDSESEDISSGTGSMPRSRHSSSDRHRRAHSRNVSSSSRERTSSSRGSRCSSHPLASSTLISDPSSNTGCGSLESGSVYTWSIEDSSDSENLEQSYLRSKVHRRRVRAHRLQHRARRCSTVSRSSRSHKSGTGSRPTTSVGADSPPQEQALDSSLHLTALMSVIEQPLQSRLAGEVLGAVGGATPRSKSLPRTSTRVYLVSSAHSDDGTGQKSASAPELANPTFPDLNMAVSAIGPSNLSSELQQTVTDRSSSPLQERLELPGKSSTSGSSGSAQCQICHGNEVASPSSPTRHSCDMELLDSILTDSPSSVDSSGVHPPYNSYTSPAGSHAGCSTVSSRSSENNHPANFPAAPPPTPPTVKPQVDSVFKVPRSPAWSVKRKTVNNGHVTHQSVGVHTVTPLGGAVVAGAQGGDPLMRRKLFAVTQNNGAYNPPRVLDKKALVKKFKKFSTHFHKKDKDNIKTLANL